MKTKYLKKLMLLVGVMMMSLTASADVAININTTYSPDASVETQEYDSRIDASTNYMTNADMAPSKEDYSQMFFTIESLENNNTIYWRPAESSDTMTISASTDNGETWTEYTSTNSGSGTTIATLNSGDKLLIKGENATYTYSRNGSSRFQTSGRFEVYGNIMSLISGDRFENADTLTNDCTFYRFFVNNANLISAENLILPATTLANHCYEDMFWGCTSLTTAPELPATTLADSCYNAMFCGCTSLTTAPELPATILANHCYYYMFWGCTSLTTAPELPATTLADECYSGMFCGCTSLTTAPELPATTLADECYCGMFDSCTSLTTAPELPATTLANDCYYAMFRYCTSLTTASELQATTLANDCFAFMFAGCTSLTTAPELPATTLADECYSGMFDGCTSLTTAPELPATTLANHCYSYMFKECRSLTTAPELPATTLADGCYNAMFYVCTSLTTAPELPATTLANYCYSDMFRGCTSLTTAPELPATTLANYCYYDMFSGCTSLTTAPELPATTLANSCYADMFSRCTSLTTAPELPAITLAYRCYSNMFSGCTSLTTAPELPATTLANSCYAGMFSRCTSLTTAPELPATTLANGCYYYMFQDCTSLNYIKCLATDMSVLAYTNDWVEGVSSTGTFVKAASMDDWPTGASGIPEGWTVLNDGIEVNATNFPDETFRNWILHHIGGGWLTDSEIAEIKEINCSGSPVARESIESLQGIEFFTSLIQLSCSFNHLTSLDVSKNRALTSLYCMDNELTSLDLSNNSSINSASIGSQSTSLMAVNTSVGIAIPMTSDFDFTKVSNLRLDGVDVSGSLTTVNGQKYLVFAQAGTAQNSIAGNQLTYDYSTGNSFGGASSMDVTVYLSYDAPNTYTLSIQSGSGGSVSYDGTTITNATKSFMVIEGSPATVTITPDTGYKLSKLTVNGTDVTSSVSNNQYTISYINANTSVVATFEQIAYTLSVKATGNGTVTYNGTFVKNTTQTFTVNHGASATVTITPDSGYRLASLTVNGTNVTSSVSNANYTISNIKANTSVEVVFAEIEYASIDHEGVNYRVVSNSNKTVSVAKGNYGYYITVPASFTENYFEWTVTGMEDDVLSSNPQLAAVIWNPSVLFTTSVNNPNFLLYVTSSQYAPSSIKNVVVGNTANGITLTDAANGNNFFCPQEFTARQIAYTHYYSMATGGNGQGWESIVLPFDVQRITHSTKGEIVPFAAYKANDRSQRPFWLYRFGTSGFVRSSSISANTPYIIAMPNNTAYDDEYILAGDITFSATNVTVKPSSQLSVSTSGGKTFTPAYQKIERSSSVFALNVNNRNASSSGGYDWGSRFIGNLRDVYPFEAYMLASSAEAREFIDIEFGDEVTGLDGIPMRYDSERKVAVYSISGQLIMLEKRELLDEKLHNLPSGVYIVDGNKIVVQ